MKVRVRGILFDMDGVLISSIGSVERSWTRWAELHGLEPEHVLGQIHGRRSIDSIRFLRPEADAEAENIRIEDWEIEDTEGLEVLAGVRDLLRRLPAGRWTIVTSATERLARIRLEAAGIPVPERFITAEMVVNGKPHPEPYVRGAEVLGLKPEDCLVIEDAASGARAGREAGCKVLATTFSHSVESLESADWIVESLESLRVATEGDFLELEFDPVARVGV